MLIKHQLVHCRFSTRPVELDLRRRYHDFPSADAPPLRFYPAVFVILLSGSRVEPFVQVDKLWPSLIFEDDAQAGCQLRAETARARTRSLNSRLARTERPPRHRKLSTIAGFPVGCASPNIVVVMSVYWGGDLLPALLPVMTVPPPPPITVFLGPRVPAPSTLPSPPLRNLVSPPPCPPSWPGQA